MIEDKLSFTLPEPKLAAVSKIPPKKNNNNKQNRLKQKVKSPILQSSQMTRAEYNSWPLSTYPVSEFHFYVDILQDRWEIQSNKLTTILLPTCCHENLFSLRAFTCYFCNWLCWIFMWQCKFLLPFYGLFLLNIRIELLIFTEKIIRKNMYIVMYIAWQKLFEGLLTREYVME